MEAAVHRGGGGIKLRHGPHSEDEFHRAKHRTRRIHGRIHANLSRIRADSERDSPVSVDVVGAVLCIIFHDENRGRGPELGLGNGFDQSSQREVVVRHAGGGRPFSGGGAGGVVLWQAHDLEPRHLPLLLKAAQFADKSFSPLHIGVVHVEAPEERVKPALEGLEAGLAGVLRPFAVLHKLSVAPEADARGKGAIPEVAAGRGGDGKVAFARVGELLGFVVAVAERPELLDVVGRVGGHAPFVAVGADFAFDIKVVEQHELAGEL